MQQEPTPLPRTLLFFITFAAVGICVWFLNSYATLFNSFFLAVMIVMTASPIGFWLQNHGAPRWLALLLSVLTALTATLLFAGVLAISALRMLEIVPEFVDTLAAAEDQYVPIFGRLGITLADMQTLISPEAIGRIATQVIHLILESVSMFGLVILIVVFMVVEAFIMPLKFMNSPDFASWSPDIAIRFTVNIRQYVGITSLLGLIGGAVLALVLFLLNIPFAFLWGILYMVLNYVPMVGFWIALLPPLLLAGLTGGASTALLVLGAYMIVSAIINQGVKPAVMRGGLDLSPLWSIMSLIVWSTILGPIGLIIGVPLTIALKELVFATDEKAHWAADLLGSGMPSVYDKPIAPVESHQPAADPTAREPVDDDDASEISEDEDS